MFLYYNENSDEIFYCVFIQMKLIFKKQLYSLFFQFNAMIYSPNLLNNINLYYKLLKWMKFKYIINQNDSIYFWRKIQNKYYDILNHFINYYIKYI